MAAVRQSEKLAFVTLFAAALLLGTCHAQQPPQYSTILDFINANMNLAQTFYTAVTVTDNTFQTGFVSSLLTNSSLRAIVLLPNNVAMAARQAAAGSTIDVSPLKIIIPYIVIPVDTAYATLDATTRHVYTTYLATYNTTLTQTIETITSIPINSTHVYLGGAPPGLVVDTTQKFTAAQSTIYVVNDVLAPTSAFLPPYNLSLPLNISGFLGGGGLVQNALSTFPEFTDLLSDNTTSITLFLPTQEAFANLLTANGLDVNQAFALLSTNRTLVLNILKNHVITSRPYTLAQLANITSLTANGSDVLNIIPVNASELLIKSGGNTNPIVVNAAQQATAGQSVVYSIDNVLLPQGTGLKSTAPPVQGFSPPPPPPSAASVPITQFYHTLLAALMAAAMLLAMAGRA